MRDNFDSINTVTGSKSDCTDPASLNLKDLAAVCQQTSEVLTLQLLGSAKDRRSRPRPVERHLTVALTPTEKNAEEVSAQIHIAAHQIGHLSELSDFEKNEIFVITGFKI